MANFEFPLPELWENEIISNTDDEVIIRSSIKDMDDINKWISIYGEKTNTKWNSRSSKPCGKRILASKKFLCHHSSFNKKTQIGCESSSKNINCLASINVQIKLNTDCTRRKDPFVKKGMLGIIRINKIHSHNLNTSEALRFLPANSDGIREKFIDYFNAGMGIAEACRYHEQLLEVREEFTEEDLANSRINPTKRSVRYWHDNWRLSNLGPRTGVGMIQKLKEKQEVYLKNEIKIVFSEAPFVVAVITPIMMRAHALPSSEQIVFVDSTSACDSENHSITFMLTPCAAGAVPLAMFISKGQTEEMYRTGFKLIRENIPQSFNDKTFPNIFITDNSQAEINAIKSIFPDSKNYLCIFHVCQAVWRWLWDSNHHIPKHFRSKLMMLFQNILYATSFEKAEEEFEKAKNAYKDFPQWNTYLESHWKNKELWCLAFRDGTFKGHHTNNFSETAIRIFKDVILSRMKAYNIISLIDISCVVLEQYYCHRLREFANSRNSNARLFLAKTEKKAAYVKENDIKKVSEHEYLVPSEHIEGQWYTVNTAVGVCECSEGLFGKFCKHQCAIYKLYNVSLKNLPPVTPLDRYNIAKIAFGDNVPPLSFYYPLQLNESNLHDTIDNMSSANMDLSEVATTFNVECNPLENATAKEQNSTANCSMEMIIELLKNNDKKFGSSVSGLDMFHKRLSKITSEGQWETFLHTAGREIPLRKRAGIPIRIQPSSISRRAPGVTRGSKRLPSGRPAKGENIIKKRKRNLMANIKLNQPNAKSHGIGH